jgi:hypothetical protein
MIIEGTKKKKTRKEYRRKEKQYRYDRDKGKEDRY